MGAGNRSLKRSEEIQAFECFEREKKDKSLMKNRLCMSVSFPNTCSDDFFVPCFDALLH